MFARIGRRLRAWIGKQSDDELGVYAVGVVVGLALSAAMNRLMPPAGD